MTQVGGRLFDNGAVQKVAGPSGVVSRSNALGPQSKAAGQSVSVDTMATIQQCRKEATVAAKI